MRVDARKPPRKRQEIEQAKMQDKGQPCETGPGRGVRRRTQIGEG